MISKWLEHRLEAQKKFRAPPSLVSECFFLSGEPCGNQLWATLRSASFVWWKVGLWMTGCFNDMSWHHTKTIPAWSVGFDWDLPCDRKIIEIAGLVSNSTVAISCFDPLRQLQVASRAQGKNKTSLSSQSDLGAFLSDHGKLTNSLISDGASCSNAIRNWTRWRMELSRVTLVRCKSLRSTRVNHQSEPIMFWDCGLEDFASNHLSMFQISNCLPLFVSSHEASWLSRKSPNRLTESNIQS